MQQDDTLIKRQPLTSEQTLANKHELCGTRTPLRYVLDDGRSRVASLLVSFFTRDIVAWPNGSPTGAFRADIAVTRDVAVLNEKRVQRKCYAGGGGG